MCDETAPGSRRSCPARRDHDQLAVVAGEPLGDPQAAGLRRVLVIKRAQLDGPEPLDIEGMEILMADEGKPAKVPGGVGRPGRSGGEQGRVLVLEASAAPAKDVQEDDIS